MLAIPKSPDPRWQIALVDDDATVLRSLSRMLSMCGYDVTTFPSATAFLSSLERWQPQMLLVDLRMPGTDGLTLQSMLTERGIRIPTVFLSGHGDVSTSVRAIRAGAFDFLREAVRRAGTPRLTRARRGRRAAAVAT